MNNPLEEFCNSSDCNSKIKILRTMKDIKNYHNDHIVQVKTFEELSQELQTDNHALKNLKKTFDKEHLDSFIDEEIIKLSKTFDQVLYDLKDQLKNYLSTHVQFLKDLVDLYHAVIQRNDAKIEELQYAIPNLSISSDEIVKQKGMALEVKQRIEEFIGEITKKIMLIPKTILKNPSHPQNYKWSETLKHQKIQIVENLVQGQSGADNMILLEPSFTMSDVTKVKLKITQLSEIWLSLCDVNVAKKIRPTWDHRYQVGEGAYSHQNNGGIYPHHLTWNQTQGQVLAFSFKEGDELLLEWNGPLKQFRTSKMNTNERYF